MKGKDIKIIVHFIDGKEKEIILDKNVFEDFRYWSDFPKPEGNFIEISTGTEVLIINWSEIKYIEGFKVEEDEDQKD